MNYTLFNTLQTQQGTAHTVNWSDFCHLIEQAPAHLTKDAQPLIKLGTFQNNSRAGGSPLNIIYGVEIDYDDGLITPEQAADALTRAGITAIVCSTYTSTSEFPKWRAFLPLSKPYKARYRAALVHAVDNLFGGVVAPESYRDKQIFFVGRNPDADTDYTVINVEGKPLDTLPELRQSAQEYFKQHQQAVKTVKIKPKRVERLLGGQASIIDSFNDAYGIHSILNSHGYTFKAGKYCSPESTSGMAGVNVLVGNDGRDRVFSHHDNDILNNGLANDAFDCFTILEHGGDVNEAIKAAGNLLFTSDGETLTSYNRSVYQSHKVTATLNNITPDNLTIIGKVARCLRGVTGGFELWVSWGGERATPHLWRHLLQQPPHSTGYLYHLAQRSAS